MHMFSGGGSEWMAQTRIFALIAASQSQSQFFVDGRYSASCPDNFCPVPPLDAGPLQGCRNCTEADLNERSLDSVTPFGRLPWDPQACPNMTDHTCCLLPVRVRFMHSPASAQPKDSPVCCAPVWSHDMTQCSRVRVEIVARTAAARTAP